MIRCKPDLLLLTTILWRFARRQDASNDSQGAPRVNRDDELEVYSIQATLFGIVFGTGLAFIAAPSRFFL